MGQFHAKAGAEENMIKQTAARTNAFISLITPSPVKPLGWKIKYIASPKSEISPEKRPGGKIHKSS
jgi:hypothetical protein